MRYKFPSSGQSVDDALVVTQTLLGNSLKPLAPVNLRGSRNTAGDLLIEWTRRERLPLGLRDYAGTPLSEEKEIYVVEIYSGATLKRTLRMEAGRLTSEPVRWRIDGPYITNPTVDSEGTVTIGAPSGGDFTNSAISQVFYGDFELEIGANPSNANIPNLVQVRQAGSEFGSGFQFTLLRSQLDPNSGCSVYDGVNTVAIDLTYPTRGYLVRTGSEIKFYLGSIGRTNRPEFIAAPDYSGPLTVRTLNNWAGSTGVLYRPRVATIRSRAWIYTALMQVHDFGSTQSSIKVHVMQESAIVGRGNYIESNL